MKKNMDQTDRFWRSRFFKGNNFLTLIFLQKEKGNHEKQEF